jgi:hypothetical protein
MTLILFDADGKQINSFMREDLLLEQYFKPLNIEAWLLFKTVENETEKADLAVERNPND